MSLNALASQFSTASQALAALPTSDRENPVNLTALTAIERTQAQLKEDMDALREQVEYLRTRSPEKEKMREQAEGEPVESYELRMQAVEKRVEEIAEAIRLEYAFHDQNRRGADIIDRICSQARLYARLLNSTVTTNKMKLTPPVMANGKTPQNFPATRGEFEHLTSTSRYSSLARLG